MSNRFMEIVFDTTERLVKSPVTYATVSSSVAGLSAGYYLAPTETIEIIKEIPSSEPSPELLKREQENEKKEKELALIQKKWEELVAKKLKLHGDPNEKFDHKYCMRFVIVQQEYKDVPYYKERGSWQKPYDYEKCMREQRQERKAWRENPERAEAAVRVDIRMGDTEWEPKIK